jgi:hypothetical protein
MNKTYFVLAIKHVQIFLRFFRLLAKNDKTFMLCSSEALPLVPLVRFYARLNRCFLAVYRTSVAYYRTCLKFRFSHWRLKHK